MKLSLSHTVAASAVLAGAIAAAVAAPSTARTNPLKISMVAATGSSSAFLGAVDITVTNTSRHAVRVPKWQLPSDFVEQKVFQVSRDGQPSSGATGAVLGGVVGAVAGRELADDSSKGKQNTATVAGAVAGAVAGSAIQKNMAKNNAATYTVYVRMNDGNNVAINQADIGGIREGSFVRVYDGRVWLR